MLKSFTIYPLWYTRMYFVGSLQIQHVWILDLVLGELFCLFRYTLVFILTKLSIVLNVDDPRNVAIRWWWRTLLRKGYQQVIKMTIIPNMSSNITLSHIFVQISRIFFSQMDNSQCESFPNHRFLLSYLF